jgi:hypothetical protein
MSESISNVLDSGQPCGRYRAVKPERESYFDLGAKAGERGAGALEYRVKAISVFRHLGRERHVDRGFNEATSNQGAAAITFAFHQVKELRNFFSVRKLTREIGERLRLFPARSFM